MKKLVVPAVLVFGMLLACGVVAFQRRMGVTMVTPRVMRAFTLGAGESERFLTDDVRNYNSEFQEEVRQQFQDKLFSCFSGEHWRVEVGISEVFPDTIQIRASLESVDVGTPGPHPSAGFSFVAPRVRLERPFNTTPKVLAKVFLLALRKLAHPEAARVSVNHSGRRTSAPFPSLFCESKLGKGLLSETKKSCYI